MRQSEHFYAAHARVVGLSYSLQHDLSLSYRPSLPTSLRPNILVLSYFLSIGLLTRRIREPPALSLVVYEVDVLTFCVRRQYTRSLSLLSSCPGLLASVTATIQRSPVTHRSPFDRTTHAPRNTYTNARSIGKLVDTGPSPAIPDFHLDIPRHPYS